MVRLMFAQIVKRLVGLAKSVGPVVVAEALAVYAASHRREKYIQLEG